MTYGWCDLVNVEVKKWFEVEAAKEYLEIADATVRPGIDPLLSPACYTKVTEVLAKSVPLEIL